MQLGCGRSSFEELNDDGRDLSLSEDLSFTRKWMDEVVVSALSSWTDGTDLKIPELEVDESDKNRLVRTQLLPPVLADPLQVYKLGQEYLIAFESTANISAETFEGSLLPLRSPCNFVPSAIICIGKCLQPSSRSEFSTAACDVAHKSAKSQTDMHSRPVAGRAAPPPITQEF